MTTAAEISTPVGPPPAITKVRVPSWRCSGSASAGRSGCGSTPGLAEKRNSDEVNPLAEALASERSAEVSSTEKRHSARPTAPHYNAGDARWRG